MKNQSTGEISPNFSHRYMNSSPNHIDLTDTICFMTGRAISVLHLIASEFEDSLCMSDKNIYGALDSAITEIQDIRAYVQAFSKLKHK
jgi:hypothetical protein